MKDIKIYRDWHRCREIDRYRIGCICRVRDRDSCWDRDRGLGREWSRDEDRDACREGNINRVRDRDKDIARDWDRYRDKYR